MSLSTGNYFFISLPAFKAMSCPTLREVFLLSNLQLAIAKSTFLTVLNYPQVLLIFLGSAE
ncbi:hypothetical protein [Polynucleobacter sp. AP-Reno-20A-A9]|uniref:hypothetical protein n=1 Tax=Polynucleobacter sp. AP-Reno-20A-A9 TaxID=2576925 RepID=UPI001C0AF9C2|nr:hypothetical protein [Polynucleobacter sp. AP-Reno-20A-A9]MBU3627923.1 hypothetical protein [Polynucleobacter sp. AP-Reno-20A-A9]